MKGTYVSVESLHLIRNLDEQFFRFNLRHDAIADGETTKAK